MTIDRIFIGFAIIIGVAAGAILVVQPESRNFLVSPYLWVLIAMALFEAAAFAFYRGVPGQMVSNGTRLLGFILSIMILEAFPILAGAPGRLF